LHVICIFNLNPYFLESPNPMRDFKKTTFIIFILANLFYCGNPGSGPVPDGKESINISVLDNENSYIEGAEILIQPTEFVAFSEGNAVKIELPSGDYSMTIAKPGMKTEQVDFELKPGEEEDLRVTLYNLKLVSDSDLITSDNCYED